MCLDIISNRLISYQIIFTSKLFTFKFIKRTTFFSSLFLLLFSYFFSFFFDDIKNKGLKSWKAMSSQHDTFPNLKFFLFHFQFLYKNIMHLRRRIRNKNSLHDKNFWKSNFLLGLRYKSFSILSSSPLIKSSKYYSIEKVYHPIVKQTIDFYVLKNTFGTTF